MSTFSRRHFLKAAAATSLVGLPSFNILRGQSASDRAKEKNPPVKIGYLPITDSAPLLVAHANKLYEKEGLTAEQPVLFRSWAQITEAFVAGQVNVVHLLSPITIWLRYGRKVPAKVVAWNHTNGSGLTLRPDFQNLQDLAGQTVAVPFWYSIHNVVLQLLLQAEGLKVNLRADENAKIASDEVKLVVLPPPDMISAIANKSIGGYIVAEPFNAAAEAKNIGKMGRFTGDVWEDHACCVVVMRESDLTGNPEWSQRVVNAVVKAQQWSIGNRSEVSRILSKESGLGYTPHPRPVLDRVLTPRDVDAYVKSGAIKHPDWHEPRIDFQPYPFPSYTEELVRRLKHTQVLGESGFLANLDPAFAARDLVDDSFVRTALREIGGPGVFNLNTSLTRQERIVT